MARLQTQGWEINDVTTTVNARTGSYAAFLDSGAGNAVRSAIFQRTILIPNTTATYNYWVRFYCYFETLPLTTDVYFMRFETWQVSTGQGVGLKLTTTGLLKTFHNTTASAGSHPTTIQTGRWYRIEAQFKFIIVASTSRTESIEAFRVDGVDSGLSADSQVVSSATPASVSFGVSPRCGWLTAAGANSIMRCDDAAWNDDSGANQNTWTGDGRVVWLVPTSDNARASLWTGGAGGTTNLFEAVNNLPPIGTATETDLTQIEHAGGAAGSTDAYDANMTTYAAAGIGPTDTINVISMMAWDGEDSATGAKLLAYSVVSNPAIASPGNVTAGDDAGALGTWPNVWAARYDRGTVYNSTVTVGTAPVMRVVRPETASRVASVCLMAISVDFSQNPVPSLPKNPHYHQLLAH